MDKYQLNDYMNSLKNRARLYGALCCGKCPKAYREEVFERLVGDLLFYGNIILFCCAIRYLTKSPSFPCDWGLRTGAAIFSEETGKWEPLKKLKKD